jgi:SAM-dependent methyltransferase
LNDPSSRGTQAAYDPSWFSGLAAAEERHFWFIARSELIAGLVGQLLPDPDHAPWVVEVGCGTGKVLSAVGSALPKSKLVAFDYFSEGLEIARTRSTAYAVQGDANALPFLPGFDLAGMFDVLEHIPEDVEALARVREILRPGGWLLVTVPALRSLWSDIDVHSGHQRRYTRQDLDAKLNQAGFVPHRSSYFMASLFVPTFLLRRISSRASRRTPSDRSVDELTLRPTANRVALALLRLENRRLLRGRSMPIGTSLVTIARAP